MAKIKISPIETNLLFDFKKVDGAKIPPGCLAVLEGYATLSDDKSNRNKHFYPTGFWNSVLDNNQSVAEKLATKTFFGAYRHPEKEESPIPEFGSFSHNIRDYRVDKKGVFVTLDVFDNTQGRELKPLIDYGSQLGISTRAYGEVQVANDGYKTPILDKYLFVTWDLVSFPAFSETRMTSVSDSVVIEVDDSIFNSKNKQELLDSIKKLEKKEARMLCDYMDIDFKEISDSFSGECSGGCSGKTCGRCKDKSKEGETDVEKALGDAMNKIVELETELGKHQGSEDSTGLQNKIAILTDENTQLKNSINLKQDVEKARLKNSVEFLKEKIQDMEADNAILESKNKTLRSIVDSKHAQVSELSEKLEDAQTTLSELRQEFDSTLKLKQALEDKLSTIKVTNSLQDNSVKGTTNASTKAARPMLIADSVKPSKATSDIDSMKTVFKKLKS
jgi:hypothetical protein